MYKLTITLLLCFALSSCVKFQVDPGNVVGDTVNAGKEVYTTIKRNRNGEEERNYTHSTGFSESQTTAANVASCKEQIVAIIIESSYTLKRILSESSKVIEGDNGKTVECEVRAVVKANA